MALLEARGIVRRFGQRAVLDGIDLTVEPGEAVLIRGRSGTGKSTLLNLLAGLDVPDAGHVRVTGADLATLEEPERAQLRLREVGFVFQHFNLISDLTVEENVRLPMQLAKRPDARTRSVELLDRFGLKPLRDAFPETLSGGEMQRVGIVRALANQPSLVLADEPTANLDEGNARTVLDTLLGVADDGRAVIVASHDPIASRFIQNSYDLIDGRLHLNGTGPAKEA